MNLPKSISKIVSEKEFLFTLLANKEKICPRLISWKRENEKYTIISEKYTKTLIDVKVWYSYQTKAVNLLKKLHSLGIVHCDITEDNIVVNPTTGDVRLIDFGLSEWEDHFVDNKDCRYPYDTAQTVKELLKEEMVELCWLFDQNEKKCKYEMK